MKIAIKQKERDAAIDIDASKLSSESFAAKRYSPMPDKPASDCEIKKRESARIGK